MPFMRATALDYDGFVGSQGRRRQPALYFSSISDISDMARLL